MSEGHESEVLGVYGRHGPAWAILRGDVLVESAWLDRFCDLLVPTAHVLDIGCGSGRPIARELRRRGNVVTGLDGASAMVELFRHHMPGASVHLADMRRLDLQRRFDGLLAWDSLFHLSPADQRPMFARLRAHAEPGAVLMFTSGTAEGSAIGELEGEALYHGSLAPEEYRTLLDAAGFELLDHVINDPGCDRTVWLARRR